MGGFTLPQLPDLLAMSNLSLDDLGHWTPPDSAGGPQKNNVASYSAAAAQDLNCDPIKGCPSSGDAKPTTTLGKSTGCDSWYSFLDPTCLGMKAGAKAAGGNMDTALTVSSLTWGRTASFVVGLIAIAGGILLFATADLSGSPVSRIVGAAAIV